MSDIALVGGTESMSQAPYAVRNVRFGTRLGQDLKVAFSSPKASEYAFDLF